MPHRSGTTTLARRLGRRIRALREEAGITQEKLAWESDISKNHLSQIESGVRVPSVPVVCALAKRLELLPADLLAFESAHPRVQLLDAARRTDRDGVAAALKRLGLI